MNISPVVTDLVASKESAAAYSVEGLRRLRTRAQTELAFLAGDTAHGGPSRVVERELLRDLLIALDAMIAERAR